MKVHSKTEINKRKIYNVFTAIALAVIAGFLVISNWRILGKTMDSIKYRKVAEANLEAVSGRELGLVNKLDELETDTGLDKEIRERFSVAKPGEEVIMIVSGNGNDGTNDNGLNEEVSLWQKFLNFLKK